MRTSARAAAVVAALVLSGCGSQPEVSPPTGVDGLTIPTPDPEAGDFVRGVTNPLFPLEDGARWTYEAPDGSTVRLSVLGQASLDGVPVTTVRRVEVDPRGRVVGERRSAYAQDVAGNVWSFGREVVRGDPDEEASWRAGEDGAEAGLLVPADPRVGDAWLQQRSEALTTRVEVLDVDARVAALGGQVEALRTSDSASAGTGVEEVVRSYAPGLGVVLVEDESGEVLLELTERTP